MYTYGAGPRAFVPHSAINLSVKTPELPETASSLDLSMAEHQQQTSSQFSTYTGSSPQILDLTRQEAKKEASCNKTEQTEPVDFSSNTSAYTYTTTSASAMVPGNGGGSFSTTESGSSSTTDTLNRYRSNPIAAGKF